MEIDLEDDDTEELVEDGKSLWVKNWESHAEGRNELRSLESHRISTVKRAKMPVV